MHGFVRLLLLAGIACACCVEASAQQAEPLTERSALTHAAQTATTPTNHAAMAAEQDPLSVASSVAEAAAGDVTLTPAAARAAERFRIDPVALSSGAVKAVTDGHAEVVKPDTVADEAARDTVFVTRTSAEASRMALPSPLRAALPTTAPTSAVRLGYTLSATTAGANGSRVRLVAVVGNNTGLMLDAVHSVWRGGFWVALSNPDDPADRRTLNVPITLAINAPGASEVTPAPLDIADVGRWHPVRVTVPNFPGDTYRVAVSADPQDPGNGIDLPVSKPTIRVSVAPAQITGWGIEQAVITVRADGLTDGYSVTLRNDHGSLSSTDLKLDAQGVATARLRSDSAASASVSAGAEGVVSEPVTVSFKPPWLFLAAAIAGGLLGAFIRGKGRSRARYAAAIGVASAVLMTLAYAVGIDWVSGVVPASRLATSGEAVVFVLGAIAALVGVHVLVPAIGEDKDKDG